MCSALLGMVVARKKTNKKTHSSIYTGMDRLRVRWVKYKRISLLMSESWYVYVWLFSFEKCQI